MRNYIIYCLLFILWSCNVSSNSGAVAFLWDEEPAATASRIMVVSELDEEQLRINTINHLEDLGFVIDENNEDEIITEALDMQGNIMRITAEVNDNVIIISGQQAEANNDDIHWEPVIRGEDEDPYASSEWELMNVLANSISHTSIRYN